MLVSQDLGVHTTHGELLSSPLSKAPGQQQCLQGHSLGIHQHLPSADAC